MSLRVLIVDDEVDVTRLLGFALTKAGCEVQSASTGKEALELAPRFAPAVVVLDVMLPDQTGLEVCRRMRGDSALGEIGILMVTARGEEIDRVLGLEVGADDYVVKPFSVREVVLRVIGLAKRVGEQSAARHAGGGDPRVLRLRELEVDLRSFEVRFAGVRLELRPLELKILATLVAEPGRVFSRQDLLEQVWGIREPVNQRTVDAHIQRLRKNLGPAADMIETVARFGYRAAA